MATVSFMPPKTIVLVGLSGCGKTSIGRRLAKRLELEFSDSDEHVKNAAGCSIEEIKEIYGEEELYRGECRVIKRLLGEDTHILATGGETFFATPTRELIKEESISVWLKADVETLFARLSRRVDSPNLTDEEQREEIKQKVEGSQDIFACADVHVDTFDEPTNTTVERVIQATSDFIQQKYPNYYVLKSV